MLKRTFARSHCRSELSARETPLAELSHEELLAEPEPERPRSCSELGEHGLTGQQMLTGILQPRQQHALWTATEAPQFTYRLVQITD